MSQSSIQHAAVQKNGIQFYDYKPELACFGDEVINGLKQKPPRIPPKFFYDKAGSEIFDAICETDEYYVTRTEISILERYCDEIGELIGPGCILAEPGSGNSRKVRTLLESIKPDAYLPMDISKDYLRNSAQELAEDFPWLDIHAACIDYTKPIDLSFLQTPNTQASRKVAFFPGSSIGNFEPQQALVFMKNIARMVEPDGGLLIGVDLKKDPDVLNAAYNDQVGVTADFNLNLLNRINEELDGNFEIEDFSHRAFYNAELGRVEMHLVCQRAQTVSIEQERFHFSPHDFIHTENSYKYHIEEFRLLAQASGFRPVHCWTDDEQLFSVHFLEVLS